MIIVQANQVCNSGDAVGAGLLDVTVLVGNGEPVDCGNNPN